MTVTVVVTSENYRHCIQCSWCYYSYFPVIFNQRIHVSRIRAGTMVHAMLMLQKTTHSFAFARFLKPTLDGTAGHQVNMTDNSHVSPTTNFSERWCGVTCECSLVSYSKRPGMIVNETRETE